MSFKDGDFLEIEYSAWNAADDRLIFTTSESKAKEAGIYDKDAAYGPALVVLGRGATIRGLDRELRGMEPSDTKRFTFKPEDAFGERNEELVRVMPQSAFKARDIEPYVGLRLDIDGASAVVKSVNSGRVVVDANHPYAGREITYEVTIKRSITDAKERVDALGSSYKARPTDSAVNGDTVELSFGDSVRKDGDYFMNKTAVVASIFTDMDGIGKVLVHEEYLRPKKEQGG